MTKAELNKKIRKLILENPELPIKFMIPEEANDGSYPYVVGEPSNVEIEEVAEWGDVLYTKDDFEDAVYSDIESDYIGKSEEELNKAVDEELNKTKFEKIIAIWISE